VELSAEALRRAAAATLLTDARPQLLRLLGHESRWDLLVVDCVPVLAADEPPSTHGHGSPSPSASSSALPMPTLHFTARHFASPPLSSGALRVWQQGGGSGRATEGASSVGGESSMSSTRSRTGRVQRSRPFGPPTSHSQTQEQRDPGALGLVRRRLARGAARQGASRVRNFTNGAGAGQVTARRAQQSWPCDRRSSRDLRRAWASRRASSGPFLRLRSARLSGVETTTTMRRGRALLRSGAGRSSCGARPASAEGGLGSRRTRDMSLQAWLYGAAFEDVMVCLGPLMPAHDLRPPSAGVMSKWSLLTLNVQYSSP